MKSGSVEFEPESQFLFIGSTGEYPGPLPEFDEVVNVSDSHLVMSVRVQSGPVRVEFWSDVELRGATLLFRGEINLPDGKICVTDIEGLVRYVRRYGAPGRQRIAIAVDQYRAMSRIYVVAKEVENGGFTGPWFGMVGPSGRATHLELMSYFLSGCDSARERLSAVIYATAANVGQSAQERSYEMYMVREWLRWLAVGLQVEDCVRPVERISEFVSSPASAKAAYELAASIVSELSGAY